MVLSWKWVSGTFFDPYTLFLLAAAMFHAGQQMLVCLDMNTGAFLYGMFPPEVSRNTALLVLFSFALLHLGALIASAVTRKPKSSAARDDIEAKLPLLALGWTLFAISILPAAIAVKGAVSSTMAGGYFYALYAHQRATGFAGATNFFAVFLIPSTLFLLAGSSNDQKVARTVSAVVLILYCAVFLFIGGRTVAAVSLPVYAWLWDRLVRPIPRALIISALLIGLLVVFPLISITRNTSGEARLSWDYLKDSWSSLDRPAAASLSETGGSLVTVAYTLELVPLVRDYDLGLSYAFAASTLFPNLFWDIHPAIAHGSPGNWMMSVVAPDTAAAGGGLGYSFIAEAYFNFGWFGPLFIGLLGFSIGWLARWCSGNTDPVRCACVANALMPLLWASRNDAAGAFRDVVWMGVLPYIGIRVFRSLRHRTVRAALERASHS